MAPHTDTRPNLFILDKTTSKNSPPTYKKEVWLTPHTFISIKTLNLKRALIELACDADVRENCIAPITHALGIFLHNVTYIHKALVAIPYIAYISRV